MKNIKLYEDFINEKKPKGAPDFHHSDAPDAEGRFRDLSPKKLAAWLIKTRNKDLKKISGSLTQQVVFNRNEDPEYAEKMERTRKEVYKQLGRQDLLDNMKESLNERDTLAELNEMTLGQLERIEDYAEMIAERMEGGQELESWMFSQITVALENLNSVHDAMDGDDGVKEGNEVVNERVLLIMKDILSKMVSAGFSYKTDPKMRKEIEDAVSNAIKPILKDYGYAIHESFDDEEDDRGPIDESSYRINKYSPNSYAQRVAAGSMSFEEAMEESGLPFTILMKLVKKIDKTFKLTFEANKKPGPDGYMTGLDDKEKEDKEEAMKKQAEMDDDDPEAYKELPGDKEAREKGQVKTSKHVKNYHELYGDETDESLVSEKTDYQYKESSKYPVKATVCYLDPMTRQRKCKAIFFKTKFDALGFKGNVKGFPKGAAVEAIKEDAITELRVASAGSTSAAFWHELEDRKYELKKPVKGVNIGNHSKVTLPKGTIIHNLPGGLFAKHEDLAGYKSYNNNDKFGVLIKKDHQVLQDIEKNSKVLESLVTEEKAKGDRGPLDNKAIETALKKKAEETGVPIELIRIVMRRGLAAWKSGHRPGAGQEQWGYARVNSFLTKQEGTWGGADSDVAKEVRDGGWDKKLKKA